MPNWVFNTVTVSGDKPSLDRLREQLNKPYTTHFPETKFVDGKWDAIPSTQVYSNPVFSFWNVISPTNLDAYYDKQTSEVKMDNFMESFNDALSNDNSWYWWNNREWGTKWDVAVVDDYKYSTTSLDDSDGVLCYNFQTAWSPVPRIFEILSAEYPSLRFDYEYEEEQGWGGNIVWHQGAAIYAHEYDIPNSHADYVSLDRECPCEAEPNYSEFWFADCPIDPSVATWDEDGECWMLLEDAQ